MSFEEEVRSLVPQYPMFGELESVSVLDRAFRILEKNGFSLKEIEVVAQDEFSHDISLPFPDRKLFLSIGST